MNRLTLLADINTFSGYGQHAIQIVRWLQKLANCHVSIRPTSVSEEFGARIPIDIRERFVSGPQPEEWELLLHHPDAMPTPGKKTVYFSMFETTRLPKKSVDLLNRAELVIVPSQFCAVSFSASGVNVPIRIVPLGVDGEIFSYAHYRLTKRVETIFGTDGRSFNGSDRKGVDQVVDAFCQAFHSDSNVRLIVKRLSNWGTIKPVDERILVVNSFMDDRSLSAWYESLHCFVSASRGEGWGLMQQQSMAVGRPIISVRFGGVEEFFNRHGGYELGHTLEAAGGTYDGCGLWAVPAEGTLATQMKRVHENRQEAIEKGYVAAEMVKGLTLEHSNYRLMKVLQEVGAFNRPSHVFGGMDIARADYGIIAYLPPHGVGHTDVFLANMREYPPDGPVVYITDGNWPDAVKIPSPTTWFKKSDEIACYVFLRAIQEAEKRGWKHFIYLETDCRVKDFHSPPGSICKWDFQMICEFTTSDEHIAGGNTAVCNPKSNYPNLSPKSASGISVSMMIHQEYRADPKKEIPFVNGAPAIYSTEKIRKLFPSIEPAHVTVQGDYNVQDRQIGERALEVFGAKTRFRHVNCVMATAGEGIYTFKTRVNSLKSGIAMAIHPIKNRWRPAPKGGYSFYHSGDLGDIIYALKAIKLMGGGKLVLGPECRTKYPPRCPMSKDTFRMLAPLIPDYVPSVEYAEKQPECSYDLNEFRVFWNERSQRKIKLSTLLEAHCYCVGIEPLMDHMPWLECGTSSSPDIVIHRSARYRSNDFPWQSIVAKHSGNIVFVGLHDEWKEFTKEFGHVPLYIPSDFLDMAHVINGAKWFCGNQSFPCSIALGLGKNVYQETWKDSPDCLLSRDNFFNQDNPANILEMA